MGVKTYNIGSKRPWWETSKDEDPEVQGESDGSEDSDGQSTSSTPDTRVLDPEDQMEEIKEVLKNCLDGMTTEADHEWAFNGKLLNAVNPGLTLKESGIVGLPLSVHDVPRIKEEASRRNGGIGTATSDDASVWNLSPDQFTLRNPAWEGSVKEIGSKTLGMSAQSLRLELVGLRLEQASSIEPQKRAVESKAGPHLSLLLSLPSVHTGGHLRCSFRSTSKTFGTAECSEFDTSYVASYSDVTRISEPVMSGFRLLLEYRLYGSKYQEIETAGAMARYAKDFEKELSRWNNLQKSGKADPLLVYVLDDCPQHDPEDAVLTGADDLKEKYLVERCANTGMCAYLAQLQSTVDAYSNSGNSYELHSLISLAGVKTPDASRKIEIKQIISDDFFKNRDSNDSEYGTEDPWEKVYEYHLKDMVLVIIPEKYRVRFFVENSPDDEIRSWIQQLLDDQSSKDEDVTDNARNDLEALCSLYLEKLKRPREVAENYYQPKVWNLSDDLVMLIRVAITLSDKSLFEKVLAFKADCLSLDVSFGIGSAMRSHGLEWYRDGIHLALVQMTIGDTDRVLESIRKGYDSQAPSESDKVALEQWIRSEVEHSLSVMSIVVPQDAPTLMGLGLKYGQEFFIAKILPLAKQNGSNFDFASTFIGHIRLAHITGKIDVQTTTIAAREMVTIMVPTFAVESTSPPNKRQKLDNIQTDGGCTNRGPTAQNHHRASIIEMCLELRLDHESETLLAQVEQEASLGNARTLHLILMPFLEGLVVVMRKQCVAFTDPRYSKLFRLVIAIFVTKFVGMKPQPPRDWSLPIRGCGCRDCLELDHFLRSPYQQKMCFKGTGKRRDHLESNLRQELSVHKMTQQNPTAPHTLVLTKTRIRYEHDHKAWEERCKEARGFFDRIGHNALRQLLSEVYSELTELQSVDVSHRDGQGNRHRTVLAEVQAPAPQQAIAHKSGVEVIDLED